MTAPITEDLFWYLNPELDPSTELAEYYAEKAVGTPLNQYYMMDNFCIKAFGEPWTPEDIEKPETTLTGAVTGGSVTYTVKTADKLDAIPVGASYSDAGKLLDVKTVTLTLSEAGEKSDTLYLPAGKKVKLMLLDKSTYAPLTEAWTN